MVESKSRPAAAAGSTQIRIGFGPMVTLLIFSTAMLIFPLEAYFLIKRYIIDSPVYGAMGAIVVVQIIIALYCFMAWRDENKEFKTQTREKGKKKA